MIKERCDFTVKRRSDCERGLKINKERRNKGTHANNRTRFIASEKMTIFKK